MSDIEIHELVENYICGKNFDLLDLPCLCKDSMEQYKFYTAIRLGRIWKKQQKNSMYKIDFECSLRNYLLLMKRDIVISEYEPSERFTEFGLSRDNNTGRIWASLLLPEFSNKNLVKQLYMQNIEREKIDKVHNLTTNSYIHSLTGFDKFKSNEQKMAVMGALKTPKGYSCLVSMTTGGGKSLITQTVSYQETGLTIVIVPTVSLMLDQYSNAKAIIKSDTDDEIFYYHSESHLGEFFKSLEQKKARILFVSPESLIKNTELREKIEKANEEKYLKNIIIDEAHIVIEWGSSFRIDFQCLDAMRKNLMIVNKDLRTFLLSATYSDETIRQLKLFYSNDNKWIEIRCEHLRHETRFDIIPCSDFGEKSKKVFQAIDLLPRPMIVYVNSPDNAERLKTRLMERGLNNVYTFTGNTGNEQRKKIIDSWKHNEFDLLIATCAFGVGVDKRDVRTVLHTYVPENPNKYYQEAGRGGRDGLPCLSAMIYTPQDVDSAFAFVSKVITTEKLLGRWFSMIHSNRTQPLLNARYMIDTYVKPKYNENEEFIDSISNQDINWNVYVILFLRRNGLVSIDDIQYVNNKYIFYITILDRQLLLDNEDTRKKIDTLRNEEWKKAEYEFKLMKKSLNHVGKSCWSSMFNKIYRKTDEYCAGCNEHFDIVNFEDNQTLKTNIDGPLSTISGELEEFSYGSRCMLVLSRCGIASMLVLIEKKIDVIVADDEDIEKLNSNIKNAGSRLLYCNYVDFMELTTSSKYYVSGSVAIYIPKDSSIQRRIINIVENNIKKYEIKYFLYSDEDYYLTFKNKNLTEVICGPCRQEY